VKTLPTLASIATLILFVGVAASSSATPTVLGLIGTVLGYVVIPAVLFIGAAANGVRSGPRRWIGRACFVTATVSVGLGIWTAIDHPSRLVHGKSPAVVAGLAVLALSPIVIWLVYRWCQDHLRPCPECKATIRRDATRCRYCTAEIPTQKLVLPRS